jgi:uncharacterized protein YndB with AHSA1/START domain
MAVTPDPVGRFEQRVLIAAPANVVFDCFFDPDALRAWWQTCRSVTTPVVFGVYAVQWASTSYRDDVLGPLGGTFHGTIVDVRPGRQFLVAECYWIPPEGAALGPMVLEVTCEPKAAGCELRLRQDGYEPSPRWTRYYAVVSRGWQLSLMSIKRCAEARAASAGSS